MSNPQWGSSANRGNRGSSHIAPPTYTVQDTPSTPINYPNVQYYGSVELESPKPQLQPRTSTSIRTLMLCIFMGIVIGYMMQTPLDSDFRQSQRLKWAHEYRKHALERNKWEDWVAARDRELQKWEQDQAQKRSRIEWQGLQRHQCIRYGTRGYTATLANVPLGFNAMDECKQKTLQINGRELYPTRCEDEGYCGKMTGHWEVDFNEPACTPFFSEVLDKGCTGGHRRYDARLENIQEWESWQKVCSTMSASYGYVRLGPGASCSECNWGRCGHWATWFIEDNRCR